MRRLWVQLSLAFSSVILISAFLLVTLIVVYADLQQEQNNSIDVLSTENEQWLYGDEGIVSQLTSHFGLGGTLDDAVVLLANLESNQPPGSPRLDIILHDTAGNLVYGQVLSRVAYQQIILDEAILEFAISSPPNGQRPSNTLSPENLFLFLGIVGSIIGLSVAISMSRWVVAPISRLAKTVRQVGGRDFSLRVKPEGSIEIQDLAHAFNDMSSRLQVSEQLRNNLIADVAHELRTPLTVMQSNLRALLDDVHPLTKGEILTLYDQTRHLNHLVSDLHELSLADAQELPILQDNLIINEVLHPIIEVFKPVAELEQINFKTDITAEPLVILGDRVRLSQVIQNLLVNALRYTPENGDITLQLSSQNKQVCLQITDTGEGIPPQHLPRIFERFYRVDGSRERSTGGTGLGLAIGKAIIETHGGKISVTSQTTNPSGTCFTIHLPLSQT